MFRVSSAYESSAKTETIQGPAAPYKNSKPQTPFRAKHPIIVQTKWTYVETQSSDGARTTTVTEDTVLKVRHKTNTVMGENIDLNPKVHPRRRRRRRNCNMCRMKVIVVK